MAEQIFVLPDGSEVNINVPDSIGTIEPNSDLYTTVGQIYGAGRVAGELITGGDAATAQAINSANEQAIQSVNDQETRSFLRNVFQSGQRETAASQLSPQTQQLIDNVEAFGRNFGGGEVLGERTELEGEDAINFFLERKQAVLSSLTERILTDFLSLIIVTCSNLFNLPFFMYSSTLFADSLKSLSCFRVNTMSSSPRTRFM